MLAKLDALVPPLSKTLTTKLKGEPVKQEVGGAALACHGWWSWACLCLHRWPFGGVLKLFDANVGGPLLFCS